INFLNRLWAYGGSVYKDGEVAINSKDALLALRNYKKSFKYTKQSNQITTWDDTVSEFKTGDVAMTILYDSHAVELNDYTKSNVAGNIDFNIIPGEAPVLGGWSLAVNKYSKVRNQILDYIL